MSFGQQILENVSIDWYVWPYPHLPRTASPVSYGFRVAFLGKSVMQKFQNIIALKNCVVESLGAATEYSLKY